MTRPTFATWKQSSRRRLQLWEGLGRFGDRLFATLQRQPDGTWQARYGLEAGQVFVRREDAIQFLSQRAAADHAVEIRSSARIVVSRPASQMEPA